MPTLLGKQVGPVGFGMMGFTWRAEPTPHDQAFETLRAAIESGATYWNGGDFYGPPDNNSLVLLNAYFEKYPEDANKVVIQIKGGNDPKTHQPFESHEGLYENVRRDAEQLGSKKKIDLWGLARVSKNYPVEKHMETLNQCIKDGLIGGIFLSECGPDTIRRAAKVAKIHAVEVEFSMFSLDILHNGVADACAELGIPITAYSPLSRGFLTGQMRKREDFAYPQFRDSFPRFSPENFPKNLELADQIGEFAKKKGVSNTELALAWVIQSGQEKGRPEIIPIPGATTAARVKQNGKIPTLSKQDMDELNQLVQKADVQGGRYPEQATNMWGW